MRVTARHLLHARDHMWNQVTPNDLASVLAFAEYVRQSNPPDLSGVGLQTWRGGDADVGVLERCREQAHALADIAFAQGAGAFWDSGDDAEQ
jgi:hypothetical protein